MKTQNSYWDCVVKTRCPQGHLYYRAEGSGWTHGCPVCTEQHYREIMSRSVALMQEIEELQRRIRLKTCEVKIFKKALLSLIRALEQKGVVAAGDFTPLGDEVVESLAAASALLIEEA